MTTDGSRRERPKPPPTAAPSANGAGKLDAARAAVAKWHREMVKRWHPDRGNHDPAILAALNNAKDRLLQLLQA
jgi:hypothetical protein